MLNNQKNGLDDFLSRHGKEAFNKFVKEARLALKLHVDEGTDRGLILQEITRLNDEIARARTLKLLANREGVGTDVVMAEYKKHLPHKEAVEKTPLETFTPEQLNKAQTILESPDILSRMIELTKKLGFIGEVINQILLYLAFTSRLMDNSTSTIVKGQSSSGKSHLVGTISNLFPKSDVLKFSFLTAKALVHRQGDLSHKILYIAEHSGGEGADYSIRTALSEGEISIMIPEKNEVTGKWETVEKRIPAQGLVFTETTTNSRIHHENQTRLFDLYVDESETQTANILFMQAEQLETQNPETIEEVKVWRAAQTLLKNYRIYVPYAKEIAKGFPKNKTRARRDFPRLLSLIRAHALLYQNQRKVDKKGRLIAQVNDFEAILPMAEKVLAQSMKELSPKQEEVLTLIQKHFSNTPFQMKEVHMKNGEKPAYSTLQSWFKDFTAEGILEWNGSKGAASRYTLLAPGRLLGNPPIFTPNLLETLKNDYLDSNLGNSRSLGNSEGNNLDYLELPNFENEVIKSNNNRGLGEKKGHYLPTYRGDKGNIPGSTDPDEYSKSDNSPELDKDPWNEDL